MKYDSNYCIHVFIDGAVVVVIVW